MEVIEKIMKKTRTLIFICICLFSLHSFGKTDKNLVINTEIASDSLLVFKSEVIDLIKLSSGKAKNHRTVTSTNYHIINFDTNEIIFFFKITGEDWKHDIYPVKSKLDKPKMITFDIDYEKSIVLNVYLEVNPFKAISYLHSDGNMFYFRELQKLSKEELAELELGNYNKN